MIAIKLQRIDHEDVSELQRQFGNAVRFAYNRYRDSDGTFSDAQVRRLAQQMNHIEKLDVTMLQDACYKAKALYKTHKEQDIVPIFGGRLNWNRYRKHLITKKEFIANRQLPICVRGDQSHRGNRKFALDLNNDHIIFKPSKSEHYDIFFKFNNTGVQRELLTELQRRYDEHEEVCFTVELSQNHVCLIIDEKAFAKPIRMVDGRIASIDLNPNYIALVIRNKKGEFLEQEIFDLKYLSELDKKKNYKSKQDKKKWRTHVNRKRRHETIHIAKRIASQCAHYQVSDFVVEDLSIKSKDQKKGKVFNKLVLNNWMRKLLTSNLRKRCNLLGIRFKEVYAGYSSIKGQLENDAKVDSIAAAIEIGNRLHSKNLGKFGDSKVELGALSNRWKEELSSNFKRVPTWNQVSEYLKKNYPGNSYRVLFAEQHKLLRESFRMSSIHSGIRVHRFNDEILISGKPTSTGESLTGTPPVEVGGSKFI